MVELGCFDAGVSAAACSAYEAELQKLTRVALSDVVSVPDRLVFKPLEAQPEGAMTVAQVQRGLAAIGFFPGGKDDGICGYRTQSAIRLFQEYVRSVEKQPILPDGRFGPETQVHLRRWLDNHVESRYAPAMTAWQAGTLGPCEYNDWLDLLNQVKAKYLAEPTPMLQLVNRSTAGSDTRKVADWDFSSAGTIHLIGVRRKVAAGRFDDIFVLLMKGLVFKFQGSTDPGSAAAGEFPPFLVQGQHNYQFGWHQKKYLALRPHTKGVLVVRSKNGITLDEEDLFNGLDVPNFTINIHWGGQGMGATINDFSQGCQVINGSVYFNPDGELTDCRPFSALNNKEIAANPKKTRAAYNVLLDHVTALSGDLPSNTVKYMLLTEDDLALAPALAKSLDDAKALIAKALG